MWQLDYKESWELKNWCFWTVVLEKILQSPLDCKEIQPVHPKGDQSWVFTGRTDAERPWCWERLRAGGEGDDRGWDSWMASPTQWTWVWVDSLQLVMDREAWCAWFMGSQRVGHDWAMELNWTYSYVGKTYVNISMTLALFRVHMIPKYDTQNTENNEK